VADVYLYTPDVVPLTAYNVGARLLSILDMDQLHALDAGRWASVTRNGLRERCRTE
jgi:hypothetical protein